MSQEEGNGGPINVATKIAEDRRQLMLRLGTGKSAPLMIALDTASVEALIAALGAARSQMLEPVPDDFGTSIARMGAKFLVWFSNTC